jgi:C1A family cysteine protease
MQHRSKCVRVAFVAIAVAGLAKVSTAQTANPAAADQIDPPDKVYTTGALANDPAVEGALPTAERHRAFLPVAVDLSDRMPPVGNQGGLGSCGAWAVAYSARSYYTEALERRDTHQPANLPSPSYVYHLARESGCDDGTNVDRVVGVLRRGALSLADAPYTDACLPPAASSSVSRAHDFRVRGEIRVDVGHRDDAKGQLARGNPVIIRFHTSTAFQKLRSAETLTEPAPPPGDKNVGWHFVTLVGYDDKRQAFRLMNSWGTGWGDHGFAWIGYDLLRTRITHAYALDVGPLRPQPVVINTPPPPRPSPPVVTPPKPTPVVTPPKPTPVVTPPPLVAPPPPKPAPVVTPPQLVAPPPKPAPIVTPEPPVVPPPTPVVTPEPPPIKPAPAPRLSDLDTLACGHVRVELRGDQSVLSGYVASDEDLNRVKLIAASVPRTSVGNVFVAPWPQCEALQTLDKPLKIADRPNVDIGRAAELRAGDGLKIQVTSPAEISYLYVSYVQADGSVVHLVQPNALTPEPTLPRQTLVFGGGEAGKPKFKIGPPFGREMIIAIASRSPLFDHELPTQQTERDYLSDLRRALVYKPVQNMPDRELAATITTLRTSARQP